MTTPPVQSRHDALPPPSPPWDCPPACAWRGLVLALACILVGLYGLSASRLQFGYEGTHVAQVEAWLGGHLQPRPGGGIEPYSKGGLLEVAVYLPFAELKLALARFHAFIGLQQLAYTFTLPLCTVLLCLVFYGLALELYRRPATAALLTLILGLATMIWPYAKFGMETHQTLYTLAGVWALVRYAQRPSAGAAAGFGAALGALLLTKITGPVHAAALGAAALWVLAARGLWRQGAGRLARHGALALVLMMAGLAVFLLSNHWRYGGWVWAGRYGLDAEALPYPLLEGIWAVLASPNKSFFLYSPPLLIALWFWGAFWRRFPVMRAPLLILLALALWHLRMATWADETWSVRRLHFLTPVLILPLGLWLEAWRGLRRWVRALGVGLVVLGVAVQLLAVSVDYTALARVAGFTPVFSQEHYVWDPQFNHLRFNLLLLRSAAHRAQTGQPLAFDYRQHYLPVTAPVVRPPDWIFSLRGEDRLDLWYLQQRADWAGRPYWFVSPSSYGVPLLGLLALGGAAGLWLALRRGRRALA